jgi:hypothetical protein
MGKGDGNKSAENMSIHVADLHGVPINPFVTSGTYISHLQRVFSSPLG